MTIDYRVLVAELDEFSKAIQRLSACLRAEMQRAEHSAVPPKAESKQRRESKPTPLIDTEEPRHGGTRRKVLVALAQYGRPMNKAQIALFAGLSPTSGSLGQALADLRADGAIMGPGSANTLTQRGFSELGDWARLPEGERLFDYWCVKLGATAGKVLRVLRRAQEPLSKSKVAEAADLSATSGSLGQALADLRKMGLIDGHGNGLSLSVDLRGAIHPTIGVHDKSSGTSVRIDARSGHAR